VSYTVDHWSELIIDGFPLPLESDWEVNEDVTLREFGELEPDLNNIMRHWYGIDPSLGDKVDITWSCSQGRRPPAFSKFQRGNQYQVVPIEPWIDWIPAGQTTVTVCRPIYAGSLVLFDDVYASKLGEQPLILGTDYTDAGQVVTLTAARAYRSIVCFLPVLNMMADTRSNSRNERTAISGYRFAMKEV
jgi:hypothetical protein